MARFIGVLKGDLIIRGSGDPTFGSPSMFPEKDPTSIFDEWADSLEKLGIEKIDGAIIADPNYFTDDYTPKDGEWKICRSILQRARADFHLLITP